MKNPTTVPWNLALSRSDAKKLLQGFKPAAMEDRWLCRADPPDANGSFVVHLHRSWTGDEVFRMNVVVPAAVSDGDAVSVQVDEHHATIADLTWDQSSSFLATEMEAKALAMDVCRGVLGCDL